MLCFSSPSFFFPCPGYFSASCFPSCSCLILFFILFQPVLFLASISLIFLSELCSSFSDSSPNFLLQTFQFVSPTGDVFSPYSIFSLYILTFSHYFLLCPFIFSPCCCPSYMIHFPSANKQIINQNLIRMTLTSNFLPFTSSLVLLVSPLHSRNLYLIYYISFYTYNFIDIIFIIMYYGFPFHAVCVMLPYVH